MLYRYYGYTLSVNGKAEEHGSDYAEDYLTDVIGRKADSFLDFYFEQIGTENLPFLMVLSTPACHDPFTPAPQYEDSYPDSIAPRTPAFNYLEEDEGANPKHWFVNQGPRPLGDAILEEVDSIYRNRLRTMLSVDDMVDGLMTRLESEGVLVSELSFSCFLNQLIVLSIKKDNTFVIFTSDHGYHLGEFSLHKDKRQPYEFDTKIPLSVRGPGVRQNVVEETLISLVDLAPTILDMAKVDVPSDIDGTSFLPWLLETNEVRNNFVIFTASITVY